MTALILGFFASSWFGWAQERPPAAWRSPLITGMVLSLAVSATGAVFAWRHWSGHSALSEPGAMRQYGIILGVEFGVAAAGAAAIALLRRSEYVAPWICLVVGVHFFPMAPVLKSPPLQGQGSGSQRRHRCRRRDGSARLRQLEHSRRHRITRHGPSWC